MNVSGKTLDKRNNNDSIYDFVNSVRKKSKNKTFHVDSLVLNESSRIGCDEAFIDVRLSGNCNCKCGFCGNVTHNPRYHEERGKMMDFEFLKKVINQISEIDYSDLGVGVMFNGNREVTLYKRLVEAVEYAKSLSLKVKIITNGIKLTPDLSERLIKAGVDEIQLSITGTNPKVYEHYQGKGKSADTIEKVKTNVQELCRLRKSLDSNCFIKVSHIFSSEFTDELEPSIRFWKKMGVDKISVNVDYTIAYEKLKASSSNKVEYTNNFSICGTPVVKINGDVVPCCLPQMEQSGYMIGNCANKSLSRIFKSWRINAFKQKLKSLDEINLPDACKRCTNITKLMETQEMEGK